LSLSYEDSIQMESELLMLHKSTFSSNGFLYFRTSSNCIAMMWSWEEVTIVLWNFARNWQIH